MLGKTDFYGMILLMCKNKGFSGLAIIVILAILVIGGYFVWKNQAIPSTPSVDTKDWQTFVSPDWPGIKFKYPPGYKLGYPASGGGAVFGDMAINSVTYIVIPGAYPADPTYTVSEKEISTVSVDNHKFIVTERIPKNSTMASGPVKLQLFAQDANGKTSFYVVIGDLSKKEHAEQLFYQILSTFQFTK